MPRPSNRSIIDLIRRGDRPGPKCLRTIARRLEAVQGQADCICRLWDVLGCERTYDALVKEVERLKGLEGMCGL